MYFLCRYIENVLNLVIRVFSLDINLWPFAYITHFYEVRFHFLIIFFVLSGLYTIYNINKTYPLSRLNKILNITLALNVILLTGIILDLTLDILDLGGVCTGLKEPLIKINSQGFRGKEYDIHKPSDVYRIISLGDSYTFGLCIELNETYPKLLEQKLNQNLNKSFEVLNFGVPGYNTKQELILLEKIGFNYHPDVIILGIVDDDGIDYDIIYPRESLKRRIRNFLIRQNTGYAMGLSKLMVRTLESNEFKKYGSELGKNLIIDSVKEIIYEIQTRDIDLIILLYEKGFRKDIIELAEEFNITVIDMQKVYSSRKIRREDTVLSSEDAHPSKLSNQIISEEVFKVLLKNERFK